MTRRLSTQIPRWISIGEALAWLAISLSVVSVGQMAWYYHVSQRTSSFDEPFEDLYDSAWV